MRLRSYRISLICVIVLSVIGVTTAGFCDDALKKLGRGAANILTCPLEVTHQIQESNNRDGAWAAFTVGPIKGIVMTAVRGVVGAYEAATFFIPLPGGYKPILKDPEFFFEDSSY